MRQTIIITFILYLGTNCLSGLNLDSAIYERKLLATELSVFKAKSDSERTALKWNKLCLLLQHEQIGSIDLKNINCIDYMQLPDSMDKAHYLWDASICAYFLNDINYGRYYFDHYTLFTHDSSAAAQLLKLLLFNELDSNSRFVDAFQPLVKLKNLEDLTNGNSTIWVIASALVPGSGTILNGDVIGGSTSLAVNALVALSVKGFIDHAMYINTIVWGLGWGLKFYMGNLFLTDKTYKQHQLIQTNKVALKYDLELRNLLLKYPLTLRLK